jgi:hypothetical protein
MISNGGNNTDISSVVSHSTMIIVLISLMMSYTSLAQMLLKPEIMFTTIIQKALGLDFGITMLHYTGTGLIPN